MIGGWRPAVLALCLALAACAGSPAELPSAVPIPPPPETVHPAVFAGAVPLSQLPGWAAEDHLAAFAAFARGCRVSGDTSLAAACDEAAGLERGVRPLTAGDGREFLERWFVAVEARTADGRPGLLTAYFAPEYAARRTRDDAYSAPLLARPADLARSDGGVVQRRAGGSTALYPARAEIQAGATDGQVLAWLRPEDLFFLQIQGSGYLTFPDGRQARAAYAADNGRPFVAIARPMVERGLLPANGASGDAIRAWLAAHAGPEAEAIMRLNPRYIFFDMQPDDGGQPAGAAGLPLTPRRAIAVDPASWRYGDAVWIQADGGGLIGARRSYSGLVMALDTGSAIRGPVRADLYVGRGAEAGSEAGAVRHPLRMWRLVPR
jgi:membrane-bound lytic murein transglycosylase A